MDCAVGKYVSANSCMFALEIILAALHSATMKRESASTPGLSTRVLNLGEVEKVVLVG
jgi:hypothetical protein